MNQHQPTRTYFAPVEKCLAFDRLPPDLVYAPAGFWGKHCSIVGMEPYWVEEVLSGMGVPLAVPVDDNGRLGSFQVAHRVKANPDQRVFGELTLVTFPAFELQLALHAAKKTVLPDAVRILVGAFVQHECAHNSAFQGKGYALHEFLFHEKRTRNVLLHQTTAHVARLENYFDCLYLMQGDVRLAVIVRGKAERVLSKAMRLFPYLSCDVRPLSGYHTVNGFGMTDENGNPLFADSLYRLHQSDEQRAALLRDAFVYLRQRKLRALMR